MSSIGLIIKDFFGERANDVASIEEQQQEAEDVNSATIVVGFS